VKYLLAVLLLAVSLVGVIATQGVPITRSPDISTVATDNTNPTLATTKPELESKSLSFQPIFSYYADRPVGAYIYNESGFVYTSGLTGQVLVGTSSPVLVGTIDIPKMNDQQTWSAFWVQTPEFWSHKWDLAPEIDFEARTVLLVAVPVSPFGTPKFMVTRIFRSNEPFPSCQTTNLSLLAKNCPPVSSLHIQLEGVLTDPGSNGATPAIVLPQRNLVEVVEIDKTDLPASLSIVGTG